MEQLAEIDPQVLPDLENIHMPKVVILVGSLRQNSLNLRLAEEAQLVLSERAETEILIPDIPLFSEDYEQPGAEPHSPRAREIRAELRSADALLVCSPEYDGLPSAVILNVCHWASRRPERPLEETPVMLAGVSGQNPSTQKQALRLAFKSVGARVLPEEIYISNGKDVFSSPEKLRDLQAELQKKLPKLL